MRVWDSKENTDILLNDIEEKTSASELQNDVQKDVSHQDAFCEPLESNNNDAEKVVEEAADKDSTTHDNGRDKKKITKIAAIIVVAVLCVIFGLYVIGNQIVDIEASYDSGDTKAGTVLDSSNPAITVIGTKRFGGQREINSGEWAIDTPVTLEIDKTSSVTITYKKLSTTLEVECSDSAIVDFDAEYKGDTSAGTEINDKSNFKVTVKYKNGKSNDTYKDWHITEPAILESDSSVTVEMEVEGIKKNITVECSDSAIVDFDAEYKGDTSAGTEINDKSNFKVTVKYKNGKTDSNFKDWHITKSATLKADSSVTVEMEVGGITKNISIKCSSVTFVKNGKITGTLKDIMTEYQNKYALFNTKFDDDTVSGEVTLVLKDGAYGGALVAYDTGDRQTIVFQGVSSDGERLLKENDVPGSVVMYCTTDFSDTMEDCMWIAFGNLLCTLDPSISQEEAFKTIYSSEDSSIGNLKYVYQYLKTEKAFIFKVYGNG